MEEDTGINVERSSRFLIEPGAYGLSILLRNGQVESKVRVADIAMHLLEAIEAGENGS
jgi:hypothetical protein